MKSNKFNYTSMELQWDATTSITPDHTQRTIKVISTENLFNFFKCDHKYIDECVGIHQNSGYQF